MARLSPVGENMGSDGLQKTAFAALAVLAVLTGLGVL